MLVDLSFLRQTLAYGCQASKVPLLSRPMLSTYSCAINPSGQYSRSERTSHIHEARTREQRGDRLCLHSSAVVARRNKF